MSILHSHENNVLSASVLARQLAFERWSTTPAVGQISIANLPTSALTFTDGRNSLRAIGLGIRTWHICAIDHRCPRSIAGVNRLLLLQIDFYYKSQFRTLRFASLVCSSVILVAS